MKSAEAQKAPQCTHGACGKKRMNMPENVNVNANQRTSVNDETLAAETYARLLPELQGLDPAELVPINLDIPSIVATTLGALPEIRGLRQEMLDELPRFDLVAFDKLEDYA